MRKVIHDGKVDNKKKIKGFLLMGKKNLIVGVELSTILIKKEMENGGIMELQAMWWRKDGERLENENGQLRYELEAMRFELDAMRSRLRAANKRNGGKTKSLYKPNRKPYVAGVPSSWTLVTKRK